MWSPDGSHVAFGSAGDGGINIYQKAINGIGQQEVLDRAPAAFRVPIDWSRDGRYTSSRESSPAPMESWPSGCCRCLRNRLAATASRIDTRTNRLTKLEQSSLPTANGWRTPPTKPGAMKYTFRRFPNRREAARVLLNGSTNPPVWSRDGKELYFIGLDGKLMAVDVKAGPGGSFEAGTPKTLFDSHIGGGQFTGFAVAKDGRFLIPTVAEQAGAPITVVVNWTAALNK